MPEPLNEEKIANFRQRLCEVALNQFATGGIGAISMRMLAKELGYSATALYSYFKNKEEILAEVRAQLMGQLTRKLAACQANHPDPTKRLKAFIDTYTQFAKDEPAAYKLIFSLEQEFACDYPGLSEARQRLQEEFKYCAGHFGALESGQSRLSPQLLWSVLHGSVSLQMTNNLATDQLSAKMLETLALSLLAAREPTGPTIRTPKQKTDSQISFDL